MLKISIIAQNLATHLLINVNILNFFWLSRLFLVDSDQINFLTNLRLNKLGLGFLIRLRKESLRHTYLPDILTNNRLPGQDRTQ